MKLSPIVLFTYNRVKHTQQTIEMLQKNKYAEESLLFIFSDGPKNRTDNNQVNDVRQYIRNIKGFKEITIVEHPENIGLAQSIIQGVTKIVNQFGRVIVLEDDIITSKYFLQYMNEGLSYYKNTNKIMHIGAYSPNIQITNNEEVFLNRTMFCWGWATWKDRWEYFSNNIEEIDKQLNHEKIISSLNLDNYNKGVYQQFINNKNKSHRTWAVFWYINIFLNNGLCVVPKNSYTHNIGTDSSGTHCSTTDRFDTILNKKPISRFTNRIEEHPIYLQKLKEFYKG